MRRATLQLVLGVVAIDALALAVYFFAGIQHASQQTRVYFTGTWTVATALAVAVLLKRVRNARFR